MEQDSDNVEWQERLIISFRAGYGGIFGDGNFVEGDFCQECIQAVLGKWLRITDDVTAVNITADRSIPRIHQILLWKIVDLCKLRVG
jgi:hypothetical protein